MGMAPGRRILIVEDEAMVSMLLEDMIADLGFELVGPASRIEKALELAQEADFDAAILDVNLNGVYTFAIADAIKLRGLPFIFATGYGAGGLPQKYADALILEKPFSQEGLHHLLNQALHLG
jgi:CheY-like chemotaxis protein